MSFVLDTHVFFWWIADDPRFEARHRQAIEARSEAIYVSAVTGWEIGIKVKLGKWPEAAVLLPGLAEKVRAEGFEVLDLTLAQAERAGLLEWFEGNFAEYEEDKKRRLGEAAVEPHRIKLKRFER